MVNKKNVQGIAKLTRLRLTPNEVKKFQRDLSSILDYIAKLKEVDTAEIEPTSHPHLLENILRQDREKREDMERVNKLIEAAPEKSGRHVKVKAVF